MTSRKKEKMTSRKVETGRPTAREASQPDFSLLATAGELALVWRVIAAAARFLVSRRRLDGHRYCNVVLVRFDGPNGPVEGRAIPEAIAAVAETFPKTQPLALGVHNGRVVLWWITGFIATPGPALENQAPTLRVRWETAVNVAHKPVSDSAIRLLRACGHHVAADRIARKRGEGRRAGKKEGTSVPRT